jgi:hypothetical protein
LDTNECVSKIIKIVQDVGAPFTLEVVRSIAKLCNEDPYKIWYAIALGGITTKTASQPSAKTTPTASKTTSEFCWRCSACNKTFNDVRQLVNHILFFVRQKDRAHIEVYKEIKERSTKESKTFTQVAEEILRCV